METFEAQFQAATAAAKHRLDTEPHILEAHFDPRLRRIVIALSNHTWFAFRPDDAQGLEDGTNAQLRNVAITPSKFGLHFRSLDSHFDIGDLMQGHFGSARWMAARLGATGGASKSKAKTAASRTNGKLGGRPRKPVAA